MVPEPRRWLEIPGIVVCQGGTVFPTIDMNHHWIEMGDESYGWWPRSLENPAGTGIWGAPGVLNGTSLPDSRGTPTHDPHHGDPARRFPVEGRTSVYGGVEPAEAGRRAAATIRQFARTFSGNYSWTSSGTDCQEFVQMALGHAHLVRSSRPLHGPATAGP